VSLPAPGGPRPPLRVIGLGLVAVAVGFIGVGVVTAGAGSDSGKTAAAATTTPALTTTTPAPPTTTAVASATRTSAAAAPTTTAAPSSTTTTTTASAATTTTQVPVGSVVETPTVAPTTSAAGSATAVPVRVFNNSTIVGLGEKAARELRGNGWQVVEVGKFQGRFPTTTVYYRPATGEQDAATTLAASIGATSAPRIDEIAASAPGLIVVVTSDFRG